MNDQPPLKKSDLTALLPTGKHDTERAEAIIALGFPAVEPLLPSLMEWMQDLNWPVAAVLLPFLTTIGTPLAPHVREVLKTDDDVWKSNLLRYVVAASSPLILTLQADIERLASSPTPGERAEEVDVLASGLLP